MWHPVILVQLQPKRAGWFQLAACTHWFLHLAAIVEALCARAHFLRVFSGSLMNPPNRQKLWDDINRSCILLPRLLPESCRHNDRFLSVLVRLLFQAYLVLYLQDVRQNPSPALEESPHMGTEFGCKICMLCADSRSAGSRFRSTGAPKMPGNSSNQGHYTPSAVVKCKFPLSELRGEATYYTHRAVAESRFPSTMPLHFKESFEYVILFTFM